MIQFDLDHLQYLNSIGYLNTKFKDGMRIWDYSKSAMYDNAFKEYPVLMNCRGLVLGEEGYVIAFPMPKFFNIEQVECFGLPKGNFQVFDKLDGTLGIVYYHDGKWHFNTRFSFDYVYSQFMRKIFTEKYNLSHLNKDLAYMFEIIMPENRIVVDYGKTEDVFLLTAYSRHGEEYLSEIDRLNGLFKVVERYDYDDYRNLSKLDLSNKEGFVVRFDNGDRLKIKFQTYCRLHYIATGINEIMVWEALSGVISMQSLVDIMPDEFYSIFEQMKIDLMGKFSYHDNIARELYAQHLTPDITAISDKTVRDKVFSAKISHLDNFNRALVFMLYKEKMWRYDYLIWQKLKPKLMKSTTFTSYKGKSDISIS